MGSKSRLLYDETLLGVFFVFYAGLCGQIAYNMDIELCVLITHNVYVCNSQKKLPYTMLYMK